MDAQMRKQGIGLEARCRVAPFWWHAGDIIPIQGDPAIGRGQKPSDDIEKRGHAVV